MKPKQTVARKKTDFLSFSAVSTGGTLLVMHGVRWPEVAGFGIWFQVICLIVACLVDEGNSVLELEIAGFKV